jgi:hypothetical protein
MRNHNSYFLLLAAFIAASQSLWLSSFASASPNDQRAAREAWAQAVSVAKARNAGQICELNAYQSAIISKLAVAFGASPYLRNEVIKGESDSARTIRKALVGNLMLFELIGQLGTPEQVTRALVGSIWYSNDGGAAGSKSIFTIGEREVRESVLDPDTYKRHTIVWAYQFDAGMAEIVMTSGSVTRRYRVERPVGSTEYRLSSSTSGAVGYHNEPDDCSA